ncbi:MAG: hypothetical protein M1819_005471 [Sarea resinae]|nr:MAG: hypothetical protein M1819_005471 [Sarea resinae]
MPRSGPLRVTRAASRRAKAVCPLLHLPPEIRSIIFQFVLVESAPLQPNVRALFRLAERYEQTQERPPPETVLSLARTCEQFFFEAIDIYYGLNRFEFRNNYDLYVFLYMIGSECRCRIHHIRTWVRGCQAKDAFELLAQCTSLRTLSLVVNYETLEGTKHPQEDLLAARGMKSLRKVRGLRNLEIVHDKTRGAWFRDAHVQEVTDILRSELTSPRTEQEHPTGEI